MSWWSPSPVRVDVVNAGGAVGTLAIVAVVHVNLATRTLEAFGAVATDAETC